jgi:hypothetical protein
MCGSISGRGKDFLFSMASRSALAPQPALEWVCATLFPVGKAAGREADNSPPSGAEVMNGGAIPPLSRASSWHSA